jgi:glycosyltransferase involved in cell wall biosynthesis
MDQKSKKICLVSVFSHEAFFVPLSHLREILGELNLASHSILAVSPELADKMAFDTGKDDIIIYKKQSNPLFRSVNYCFLNLKISKKILFGSKDVESYVFFWATGFLLPMICAKIRIKKIIWLLPSSLRKMDVHHTNYLSILAIPLQSLSYSVADNIVLYSPNLIQEWGLSKYSDKILIAHEHFIHFETFTVTTPLFHRPLLIGYIGRLSEEKGVRSFVKALPAIIGNRKDLRVFIGGTGPLQEEIDAFLKEVHLLTHVKIAGWIPHDSLPESLNMLQLLVIPSFTEGLPNILLEAMACGTPVLATSVGAVPDIIKDGETGYILKNNSPISIAENIIRVLVDPNREKIAMNARKMVEKEFSFDITAQQWKRILNEK